MGLRPPATVSLVVGCTIVKEVLFFLSQAPQRFLSG